MSSPLSYKWSVLLTVDFDSANFTWITYWFHHVSSSILELSPQIHLSLAKHIFPHLILIVEIFRTYSSFLVLNLKHLPIQASLPSFTSQDCSEILKTHSLFIEKAYVSSKSPQKLSISANYIYWLLFIKDFWKDHYFLMSLLVLYLLITFLLAPSSISLLFSLTGRSPSTFPIKFNGILYIKKIVLVSYISPKKPLFSPFLVFK